MKQLYYTIKTLLRGGGSNVVKLVSLTLGLTIGVLLFSQIAFELSYENFYRDPERVAILRMKWQKDGDYFYNTYQPAATDLWETMPDLVECASASISFMAPDIYLDKKKVEDAQTIIADTLFFQTIGLEVLRGDPKELSSMYNAFVSEGMARQLFGDEDPIGRTLNVGGYFDVTVRGIYRDVPANTAIRHNVMLSMAVGDWGFGRGTWGNNDMYTVLFRLRKPSDIGAMNQRVQKAAENFVETHWGEDVREYSVLPLPQMHLASPDNMRRLAILAALGFSIFFVSIMNYVLAAIATMNRRAKAVGVHKCSGASSGHILGMFLWETGLMVAASIVCGWLLLSIFGEQVEDMIGTRLAELFTPQNLYVPLLTVLILFLVAGVWPGLMYARIPVTQVFRRYTDSKRGWKRGLLFVQFAGVAFILGVLLTAVVQYHDMMTRSVGFQDEGLVIGSLNGEGRQNIQHIADDIRRQPYVESVANSHMSLMTHYNTAPLQAADGTFLAPLHYMQMDKDFPQVAGLKLVEGAWPQHVGEAVIGRKTVETMHWETNAIGQKLPIRPQNLGLEEPATVVGIIEDIRNMGFFMEQTCTAFVLGNRLQGVNVRLKAPVAENYDRLKAYAAEHWQSQVELASYTEIRQQQNEEVYRFRNTVYVTGACILLIVLMGVIGYVSDETQRRSKEIAIRKVNGAEAADILRLLSVDILKVAVGAVAIGAAFSWYVSGIWMEQFPDSTLLSPAWFLAVALILLILIVAVVVLKARRIANENPVLSIKSE